MIDRKYIDRLEAEMRDRVEKAQEMIQHLDAMRRLSAELNAPGATPAVPSRAVAPKATASRVAPRRPAGEPVEPTDMTSLIDQTLGSISLEDSEEVRKAYRRLWHHASKGGKKTMNSFKKEWHDKLMARRRERQAAVEPVAVS